VEGRIRQVDVRQYHNQQHEKEHAAENDEAGRLDIPPRHDLVLLPESGSKVNPSKVPSVAESRRLPGFSRFDWRETAVEYRIFRFQALFGGRVTVSGGSLRLYLKPRTLDEAVSLLAAGGGKIVAGGTDFYPALGDGVPRESILDISALREIRGISSDTTHFHIGGLTTWTEIIREPLPSCFDALKGAAREVGSVQIQNRGTVAGNLCNASPAADGVPPLLALDAEVELISSAGRRKILLEEFVVGNRKTARRPDEILASVLIPRSMEHAASSFLKLGARRYLVISISMVAAMVQMDAGGRVERARVAVGSCSATARRLRRLEQDLVGMSAREGLSAAVSAGYLAPLSPIDDVRATAGYRLEASLVLVRRALEACTEKH
jgi:CO/xanthine dehydrogenase FAD-binding subunit